MGRQLIFYFFHQIKMIERGRERSVTEKEERDTGGARSKREVVGAKREREAREAQWFCYREAEC